MSKSIEELYQQMRDSFAARSGLSPNDSGDISLRLHAFAEQLYALWVQADWLKAQCFPQTAIGEQLEKHAAQRGLTRNKAVCAEGVIRFCLASEAGADTRIPAGSRCTTAAGVEFQTLYTGVIPSGSLHVDIPARAVLTGSGGNVAAGAVCLMTQPVTGLAYCLNESAFTGGADEESDEALRERVLSSYQRLPNGANAAFYETQAMSVEGVAAASVLARPRGAGTVDVVISAIDGMPSAELLASVHTLLQAQREICVDIHVASPMALPVQLSVQIETAEGYASGAVCAAVENAVRALFGGALLGKRLTLAELGSVIYAVPGVANYRILSPSADIVAEATQLPTLSELTITEV